MDWLRYLEYDDRIALSYRCVPSYSSFFTEVLGIPIHYTACGVNWIDTPFWMPSEDTYHAVHPVVTVAELCLCIALLVCSVGFYNEVWCSYPTVEADYVQPRRLISHSWLAIVRRMDVWDSDGWLSKFLALFWAYTMFPAI